VAPTHVTQRIQEDEGIPAERLPPKRQYALWKSPTEKIVWYPDEQTFAGPGRDDESLRTEIREHEATMEPISVKQDDTMCEEVRQNLEKLGYL